MLAEIPKVEELVQKAKNEYSRIFGSVPTIAACAPGRVNLIGEHTDYNDGFVLPMALPLVTVVVGSENGTNVCEVTTLAQVENEDNRVKFDLPSADNNLKPGNPQWANYVKGVVANFEGELKGFNMTICSSVPLGGGVSSSASVEVATFTFLECLTSTTAKPKDKALICQRAEHEFAGMPCGIMDQFISTMGKENHALLIDCMSLKSHLIPIKNEDIIFLITNSNVKHKLSGSEYPQRRAQCQNAATLLGESSLRSVELHELDALRNLKVDKGTINRAEHVISEIKRTLEAATALQENDFKKLGKLINESHNSLRDLFEVSCPELDSLVDIVRGCDGVLGSRMVGGGFGGCTITLVHQNSVDKVMESITEKYAGTPTFYICKPSNGARVLSLQ
ncbi:galactokinase-like [Arctopsyche grandis]|uniref:galactokinase-like n=1 Tax=Arctopsyche grandis TaxID=121162 RepID=UPI00406D7C29